MHMDAITVEAIVEATMEEAESRIQEEEKVPVCTCQVPSAPTDTVVIASL